MKVDIVKELLNNHSDEEIVAYLDKVATGIVSNYKTAANANQPQLLFGNIGDVTMIATIIRAMKVRNDNLAAQKQV